jgi:Protein of unknown function (DUF2752)
MPVLVAALGAAGCIALAVRDPDEPGSWGFCPFLVLTGRPCPLCGGLRAVAALERGRLVAALSSNLLVVAGVLVGAVTVLWWGARRAAGDGTEPWPALAVLRDRRIVLAGAFLVLAFGVGRWLPPLAWAAP